MKVAFCCTDVEHIEGINPNIVSFTSDADFLIHDAQYTPDEFMDER